MANRTKTDEEKIVTSGVGLPRETWERVEKAGKERKCISRNEFLRWAVELALSHHEKGAEPK